MKIMRPKNVLTFSTSFSKKGPPYFDFPKLREMAHLPPNYYMLNVSKDTCA